MQLEHALLGLVRLHQGVTGYELNRMINASAGHFPSASLSHIYPALKRLHDRGLVAYKSVPIKNRPEKKVYRITEAGEKVLRTWLEAPIEGTVGFESFSLKMSFSPLMDKATILAHIDREVAYRESLRQQRGRGIFDVSGFADEKGFDLPRAELLWTGIHQVHALTEDLRIAWLHEWRRAVEQGLAS